MADRTLTVSWFRTHCFRLINEVARDRQPITITRHGRPVAVLSPIEAVRPRSIIGAMKGSVSGFDDPFTTAWD